MEEEVKSADVHKIKKGSYIVMDGAPCQVKDIKFSAPGKHGHAKFRIEAIGIFDGKKRVDVKSGKMRVEVPIIKKKNGQILSMSGKLVQVMDLDSYETFELDLPEEEELKNQIQEGKQIMYWEVMGKREIKSVK